jgi:ABC-type Fe3+/spermidine/putrescine transport system ATPase subunit
VRVDGALVRVNVAGQEMDLRADDVLAATGGRTEVLLCIRPETLSLGLTDAPDGGVGLPGTVVRRTFLGHLMRYTVRIGQQEWLVDQPDPGGTSRAEGAVVVVVNPRRVHVIPGA